MTAGTVVITGAILASFILLCIIAVLCYCRLQYYCCKKNGSDSPPLSQQPFSCNVSGLEGSRVTPPSISPAPEPPASSGPTQQAGGAPTYCPTQQAGGAPTYCPTCSPYDSPFYLLPPGDVAYVPTHYENQALVMVRGRRAHFYTNIRAISTEV